MIKSYSRKQYFDNKLVENYFIDEKNNNFKSEIRTEPMETFCSDGVKGNRQL